MHNLRMSVATFASLTILAGCGETGTSTLAATQGSEACVGFTPSLAWDRP